MLKVFASGFFLFLTLFKGPSPNLKGKKKSHVPEVIKDAKGRAQSSIISLQWKLMTEFTNSIKLKNPTIFCYSSNESFTFGTQLITSSDHTHNDWFAFLYKHFMAHTSTDPGELLAAIFLRFGLKCSPSEHSWSISTNHFSLLECCSLKELLWVLLMKVPKLFEVLFNLKTPLTFLNAAILISSRLLGFSH